MHAKITRTRIFTEPRALQAAVDRLGAGAVADALGLTSSAINKNLRDGQCLKTTEMAATALIGPQSESRTILIWAGHSAHAATAAKFLATIGDVKELKL